MRLYSNFSAWLYRGLIPTNGVRDDRAQCATLTNAFIVASMLQLYVTGNQLDTHLYCRLERARGVVYKLLLSPAKVTRLADFWTRAKLLLLIEPSENPRLQNLLARTQQWTLAEQRVVKRLLCRSAGTVLRPPSSDTSCQMQAAKSKYRSWLTRQLLASLPTIFIAAIVTQNLVTSIGLSWLIFWLLLQLVMPGLHASIKAPNRCSCKKTEKSSYMSTKTFPILISACVRVRRVCGKKTNDMSVWRTGFEVMEKKNTRTFCFSCMCC